MNRRNFFQSIMAGIGALIGHKILPETKAEDFNKRSPINTWPEVGDKSFKAVQIEWVANVPLMPGDYLIIYGVGCEPKMDAKGKFMDITMMTDKKRVIISTDAKTDKTTN